MKRILVTGGAGFISSNMIRYLLEETAHEVVTMDALTYAGNLANLADVLEHERLRFIHGDIRDLADVTTALEGDRAGRRRVRHHQRRRHPGAARRDARAPDRAVHPHILVGGVRHRGVRSHDRGP